MIYETLMIHEFMVNAFSSDANVHVSICGLMMRLKDFCPAMFVWLLFYDFGSVLIDVALETMLCTQLVIWGFEIVFPKCWMMDKLLWIMKCWMNKMCIIG